jgi:hypothetical protein
MTYHRYAIRTLTAILVILLIALAAACAAPAEGNPTPAPTLHTPTTTPLPDPSTHCTEDEIGAYYDDDLIICMHIRGEGWRPVELG